MPINKFMEELTANQLDELNGDLKSLEHELQALLKTSIEGTKPVELDQPIGRLSRMDAIAQQKMAQANRANHKLRFDLVKAALALLERDEYGYCRKCEEPIGYGRLKAKPETPFCLECQGAREVR